MNKHTPRGDYSIAAVSKLTGIGCHALRVWERRYGFPTPLRTDSGHRRFDTAQVEVLVRMARELRQGQPIGSLMASLREGGVEQEKPAESPIEPVRTNPVGSLLDRLMEGEFESAEEEYLECSRDLDSVEVTRQIFQPAFIELGERWYRGQCEIFQERLASNYLRSKLILRLEEAIRRNCNPEGRVALGTVKGERHEGGVLMLALLLEEAGWRTRQLGSDVPIEEYQKVIDCWKPDAICISFALSRNINKRFDELARLQGAPIFVGGRSILNHQTPARRHGLHPLAGQGYEVIAELISGFREARAGRPHAAACPRSG